jgi:hypothetical protein
MGGMSVTFELKRWVALQVTSLHSVRQCALHREGYLVVQSWGGNLVHVHFADSLPKPRAVKKALQESTRIGIGALYLVDAALVPADGSRVTPDEMLLGLHALYKDKFYTFRREGAEFRIGQVHFKAVGRGDEREVWYGPDVEVRALPCYRAWVTAPASLRGEWQVASFGNEAFWKDADYAQSRDQVRQASRASSEDVFRQHTWTTGAYTNIPGGAPGGIPAGMGGAYTPPRQPVRPMSKLDRCYQTLGLPPNAPCEQVKAAFRKLARELHPDVSALPTAESRAKFQTVYEAYKFIRETIDCG